MLPSARRGGGRVAVGRNTSSAPHDGCRIWGLPRNHLSGFSSGSGAHAKARAPPTRLSNIPMKNPPRFEVTQEPSASTIASKE